MRWGPIADLWDGRARVEASPIDLLEIVRGIVPAALGAAVAIVDPAAKLLSSQPGSVRLLRVVVPAVFVVVAVAAICSRTRSSAKPMGFHSEPPSADLVYRSGRAARWLAKLLLVPVIGWLGYQMFDNAPNALLGRDTVAGYACDAVGRPLAGVLFVARDDLGELASSSATSDDNGYFVLELRSWTMRPTVLDGISRSCGLRPLAIGAAEATASGCPKDDLGTVQPRSSRRWSAQCQ